MKIWMILLLTSLVAIGGIAGVVKLWRENTALTQALQSHRDQLDQANLEVGRARTSIGELSKLTEILDKQVQEDIQERQSLLSEVAHWKAQYESKGNKIKTITKVEIQERTVPVPVDLNLELGQLYFAIATNDLELQLLPLPLNGVPFTFQDFRIKAQGIAKIDLVPGGLAMNSEGTYDFTLRIEGILAETVRQDGGEDYYVHLYELNDKGNRIGKLNLTKFDVVRTVPEKEFSWFNPRLDLGLFTSMDKNLNYHLGGSIGLSLMSYGYSDINLDWRFVRVGASLTDTWQLDLSPVGYNFGQLFPIVTNLWAFPIVGLSLFDPISYGLLVSVML